MYATIIQMRDMCPMCTWMTGPWGWLFMLLAGILLLALAVGFGWLIYRLIQRRSARDNDKRLR